MNGIGGRTLAEAKERLSYSEFLTWLAFRQQRGSLHSGMRMERGFALLASLYVNAHKSKHSPSAKLTDFMPHFEEPAVSLEEAMESWS